MMALTPAALGGAHDLLARALVFVVLAAGGLAALAAVLGRRRDVAVEGPPLAAGLAGVAFAGVVGGLIAVTLGGPGALVWLVLACLAGAAIQGAEARLAGFLYRSHGTGPAGQVVSLAHGLAATLAALTAGALLHAQQAGEAARAASVAPWAVGLGLAALTVGALLRGPGRWLGPVALVGLAVHVALTSLLLVGDGAALSAVLGDMSRGALGGAAAAGGLLGALAQGVLRAGVAGATGGLGHAAALGPRGAWLAPLVTAAVALLTGLAAAGGGLATATPVAGRELLPLERSLRAGLTPSEYGQLIVLPDDAGLVEGQRYPVVLRADPRGHRYGDVFRDENIVAAPAWAFTSAVDTVILRDSDPKRARNPGFDLRIAVTRELVETKRGPFVKLHPVDPAINIRQLMAARDLDGPFLNIADHRFEAGVLRGFQMAGGERKSLYAEPPAKDAPPTPALRDLITLDYAGPYPDAPPTPLALAAPVDGGLRPGTVAHLRLEPPARGLELGFINGLGELEVPPWEFLAGTTTAVLRHPTDPAQDREIAVRSRVAFGRLRFASEEIDLERLGALLPGFTGPHLRPPAYHFAVEVHRGARLPAGHAETSLALVPVHMHAAPTGNSNPGMGLYDPHPGEVLLTDMAGPFLDEDAAAGLVRALAHAHGAAVSGLGAAALVVLALAGLLQWLRAGLRPAATVFGPAAGPGFAVVFVICVAVGPALGLGQVLSIADAAVAVAVLLGVARLLVWLPRLGRA